MAHDVFVSYARSTSLPAAQQLRADLADSGLSVFLDEREIPFGAPFPAALTHAMLDARVIVIFADDAYFGRPWCVHELRLLTAPYRASSESSFESVVVVLPAASKLDSVLAQLPPPLAAVSWPTVTQLSQLADNVRAAVAKASRTLRVRLAAINDATADIMQEGADQPLAWSSPAIPPAARRASPIWSITGAPASRGVAFVGRAPILWQLVHECVTSRAFKSARTVVVRGLGGCGKSQLAAEFVARHAQRNFPAGVVWIDAEAGTEGLLDRFSALWREIAPGDPCPDDPLGNTGQRLQQLSRALDARLREVAAAGELLWIIDGLPEPGRGDAGGLSKWCPSLHHVTVLATTRRADTLRDADASLSIGPLDYSSALDLLTRPPVDARWLGDDEWKAVVKWAGELPLALAVLREGLIDGSLAIETLRAAPSAEPAAEVDRLMDALRGEVDDRSLRGAAEAFELSWTSLASDRALADAACRIALIAPVALPEPMLAAFAGELAVGKLVRRGWLQPGSSPPAGPRAFSLHRVPASVLRRKITDISAAYESLFNGFLNCLQQAESGNGASDRLELHLHVAFGHLRRFDTTVGPECAAAAHRFAKSVLKYADRERRGLRYLAAVTAESFGDGESFAAELLKMTDEDDKLAVASIPHALQPLRSSPTAIEWMARLLSDPRELVSLQALVHAPALDSDALMTPMLEAILRNADSDQSMNFDCYLTPGRLRASLSHLAERLSNGDATARLRVATIMGRALMQHGPELKAGGFTARYLATGLLHRALIDPNPNVREGAARSAGAHFDRDVWQYLVDAVRGDDPEKRLNAVVAAGHYLKRATDPRPPKNVGISRDDEGGAQFTVHFGDPAPPLPDEVPATLIAWVLELGEPEASAAAAVLTSLNAGLAACAPFVHQRLDTRDFATVLRLADAIVRAKPDFINGLWWRGQARVGLGDDEGACADFEAVVAGAPHFAAAAQELGAALLRRGMKAMEARRFDTAAPLLLRAGELIPNDFNAHHQASLALYNLQRHDEAEAAASRAIANDPEIGEAYFFRGIARYARRHADEALIDLRRAAELSPDDTRITEFRDEIERWMKR